MQAKGNDSNSFVAMDLSKMKHDLVSAISLLHSLYSSLNGEKPNTLRAKYFGTEVLSRVDSVVNRIEDILKGVRK